MVASIRKFWPTCAALLCVCWHENASVTDKKLPYNWGDNLYFVPCPNTGGCMFPSSSRIIAAHETNGQPDGKTHMRPI